MKFSICFIHLLFLIPAFACPYSSGDIFSPPEATYIYKGLTEEEFEKGINTFSKVFSPEVNARGKELVILGKWESEMEMAWAQQGWETYHITLFGGLARNAFMTLDALFFTLCHELGHHLGGFPKSSQPNLKWASVEGQADYFASAKCMPKLLEKISATKPVFSAPEGLEKACGSAWPSEPEYELCLRIGVAGFHFVKSMPTYPEPSFENLDAAVVEETFEDHPNSQCRLDTIVQGALCKSSPKEDFAEDNEIQGACSLSQGHSTGFRPTCWFKSSYIDYSSAH